MSGPHPVSWKTLRAKLRFPWERRNSASSSIHSCPSFQPAGQPCRFQTCKCSQSRKSITRFISLRNSDWHRSWGRVREKVSWRLLSAPLHTGYGTDEWKKRGYSTPIARTQERRKEKKEERERAQEDFKIVCLPVEMRRSRDRGTWTEQVRTGAKAATPDPCQYPLSAHRTSDAASTFQGGIFIFVFYRRGMWTWETLSNYPRSSTSLQGSRDQNTDLSDPTLLLFPKQCLDISLMETPGVNKWSSNATLPWLAVGHL